MLNIIRSNCYLYVHGHSAGGTNPSLVEAMHCEVPLVCYGNIFNKYVTENKALYFLTMEELIKICAVNAEVLKKNASEMKKIAMDEYTWKMIAHEYYEFIINC